MDLAALSVFRMALGALLFWEVWRYVNKGWVQRYYVDPVFNFTYAGFSWVTPLPPVAMEILFMVLGTVALMFTFGIFYRVCAVVLALGFTYLFLLEQARYLNHFYLICLFAFLMVFLPAHRLWSVDARFDAGLRATHGPAWTVWLLRAQLGLVYVYAGIAKLNDDWLRGEPMRMWLAARTDYPLLGQWFTEEWMVYVMSYGGLLFDLAIVPALLWRRTRLVAFLAAVAFHLMNEGLFQIGIFPWFAMAATTLYFRPDWPRLVLAPLIGRARAVRTKMADGLPPLGRTGTVVLVVFLALQVVVPLRHHLIPGDVAWTEEGHRFSWRMKLRAKAAEAVFLAADPRTGETWEVPVADHLTDWQYRNMASRPDMVAQFSRYLRDHYADEGHPDVEIRAHVTAALNGRQPQLLIDPSVDLASVPPYQLVARDWILPLER